MKKFLILLFAVAAALLSGAEKFDLQKKMEDAKKGDAKAMNEIGEYYADGGGGEFAPNYELAIMWWEAAAKNGDVRALTNLGAALFGGNGVLADVPRAIKIWNEAAKRGDPDAQFFLGTAYCNGK